MRIDKYLAEQSVNFDLIPHRDTYDAQRMAQALHVPGHEVAKTVLLKADSGYTYVVAVLPADRKIDLRRAGEVLGGSRLSVASEMEVQEHCPDCEVGALPPFGSQYGMRTLVDKSLSSDMEIVFEGNTHSESIRMRFDDFQRLEHPLVGHFAAE